MLKLKSLTIDKLYDILPTRLVFHPQRNILLGKNGTGKTTLLKLISMILRGDFSELAATEFALGFELTKEEKHIDVFIENRRNETLSPTVQMLAQQLPGVPEVQAAAFEANARIRYRNTKTKKVGEITTKNRDSVVRHGTRGAHKPLNLPMAPTDEFYFISTVFSTFAKERLFFSLSARRLDEALSYFDSIQGEDAEPGDVSVLSTSDKGTRLVASFAPARMMQQMEAIPDRLSFRSGEDIPLLDQFVAATGFQGAELRFDLVERKTISGMTINKFGKPALYCTRKDGRFFDQTQLSFGQQRLWSFLYYLACNRDVLIADELVNGLHHEWIALCVELIGERQAFLTSQNPLLFDFLSFPSPEAVKTQFVLCASDPNDPGQPMRWTQMSDEKAGEFFAAYETGVQQVAEILRMEGLW